MKTFTYPALTGYASTYCCPKAAVFLLLFSIFSLSAFAQTTPPIEVRLQPGKTAVRQITVTNPDPTSVAYQTVVKETTASLARRTVAPTSFDGLDVVYSTGFEDFSVGDLNLQNGWLDPMLADSTLYNSFMLVDASISTVNPLNGNKHVAYASRDTNQIYDSFSPQIESEQTSLVRSIVSHIKLTEAGSRFDIGIYRRTTPTHNDRGPITDFHVIIDGSAGSINYIDGELGRINTHFTVDLDQGEYVEVRIVVNRVTKKLDLYVDGRRAVEGINTRYGIVDGIAIRAWNNHFFVPQSFGPVGPSLYLDDITIADGDASAPEWISTSTATGTLPAQGESILDVAINAQDLAPGTYEAEVQVLDEAFGSITTVPVTLVVEEPPVVVVVEDLNLTSMCSDDPDEELRWRIRNPNDFDVKVTWQVYGSTQVDTVVATPGDSFFFTQTEPGANTTTIRWENENGQTRQRTKASGKAPCQPVVAEPKLLAYPTIIENELNLKIDGAGEGRLFIFSERYALIYRAKVAPGTNLVLSADELRLESGVTYYILLAIPGPNGWAIRKQTVVKQ